PRGAGGAGGPLAEGLGAQEPEEALPLIQSRAATGPAAAIHNGGSHSAAASIANTAARPRNTTEGKGPRPRPSCAASPAPFPPVFRPWPTTAAARRIAAHAHQPRPPVNSHSTRSIFHASPTTTRARTDPAMSTSLQPASRWAGPSPARRSAPAA